MIRIVLDGEPRGKGRPRFVRATGRAYTPEDTRSYEEQLRWAGQVEMRGRPLLEGALSVRITARTTVPKSYSQKKRQWALSGVLWPTGKPDLDNLIKIAADGLNKIIWADDAQIIDFRALKTYSEKPCLEIEIWTLTELL